MIQTMWIQIPAPLHPMHMDLGKMAETKSPIPQDLLQGNLDIPPTGGLCPHFLQYCWLLTCL